MKYFGAPCLVVVYFLCFGLIYLFIFYYGCSLGSNSARLSLSSSRRRACQDNTKIGVEI